MLFVYGSKMPLRLLEEIHQWKLSEKEHTALIREMTTNLESDYCKILLEWELLFAKTEEAARGWIDVALKMPEDTYEELYPQIEYLIKTCLMQSEHFIRQLQQIVECSYAVQSNRPVRIMIMRTIRESHHYMGTFEAATLSGAYRKESAYPAAASKEAAADSGSFASLPQLAASPSQAPQHAEPPAGAPTEWPQPLAAADETTWTPPSSSGGAVPIGGHRLPPLPYPYEALEPSIDRETMRIHHDILHQKYVDDLNKAEKMLEKARQTGDFDLVRNWERELAFNGAGHYLHTIFWNNMTPKGGGKPQGELAAEIDRSFGSYDSFKKQFSAAAEKVEGPGWAILVWSPRSHRLEILQAEKHQLLSQWDIVPLLVLDVWEHSYFLKYKSDRKKYIEAWWNLVNWPNVAERYKSARVLMWTPY